MPSSIATPAELGRRLDAALERVRRAAERHPDVAAWAEVLRQLERLRAAAQGGAAPPEGIGDTLDFGQVASRHLHADDPALCRDLYEIASFLAYA